METLLQNSSGLSREALLALQGRAECIFTQEQIKKVIDGLADRVAKQVGNAIPIILCVMNGGLYLTGQLLSRWSFLLELDYLHVTRYGKAARGGDLIWRCAPQLSFRNRAVVVVDDIFDEGKTLTAIIESCYEAGASSVHACVLVEKMHRRKAPGGVRPEYIGVEAKDKFLIGCGMDYKGLCRNLSGIYALPEES